MSVLAEAGFSTAIFGPAWTHEHFSTAGYALSTAERVEHAMWLGQLFPTSGTLRKPGKSSFFINDDQLSHVRISRVRSISSQRLDLKDHCLIYYPCQYLRGSKH